jgi:adenosylcobinamide-GDP ribazoletransferase
MMLRDAWRLAVGTLTAVPVTPPEVVDQRRAGVAMMIAPLAVVPLGAVATAVAAAGHALGLSALVTALLAIGAAVGGNRAFHLDGLSDTTDGLAASYDRERSLSVMKSGTAGPAGVTAIVLVIGVQAAALSAVLARPRWWQAAILAGVAVCVSRAALAVCCARGVPAARPDGLGRLYTQAVPRAAAVGIWVAAAVLVALASAWAGLPWWRGALAAALACAAAGAVTARAVARFGGVTGDVFGASVELALAALLVTLS